MMVLPEVSFERRDALYQRRHQLCRFGYYPHEVMTRRFSVVIFQSKVGGGAARSLEQD